MKTMKVQITNSNNQIQTKELNRPKTSQNKDKPAQLQEFWIYLDGPKQRETKWTDKKQPNSK